MPVIPFFLLLLLQLSARDTEPVVVLSPPHTTITMFSGGSFVKLLHQTGEVFLPWPAPKPLATGHAWYVDVQNMGPSDLVVKGGAEFSIHLRPKDTVRIESDAQTYVTKR